jgi:hypothetical protein
MIERCGRGVDLTRQRRGRGRKQGRGSEALLREPRQYYQSSYRRNSLCAFLPAIASMSASVNPAWA